MKRRDFLRRAAGAAGGTALGGLALVGCHSGAGGPDSGMGGTDSGFGGTDSGFGGSDAGTCIPTTDDVLGPFFESGAPMRTQIAGPAEPGERLMLAARVVDESCAGIPGVLADVWQADRDGNYHDAGTEYRLRGQVLTDADGWFVIDTIRPGNYTIAAGAWRPAHIHFIFARPGFVPLTTQIYFAGDPFLPPNDACTTCGSDDPARIVPLSGSAQAGWAGEMEIVLAGS